MPAGVYIHIPFCKSRCSYCDFATDVFKSDEVVERYVAALLKETGDRRQETGDRGQESEVRSQQTEISTPSGSEGHDSSQETEVGSESEKLKGKNEESAELADSPDPSPITHHSSLSSLHSSLSTQYSVPPAGRGRSDTIYFGGGTPSLLKPEQLARILETVRERCEVSEDAEITVEMNPATVTLDQLKEFRNFGVNRASFGVQTFDDRALRLLARGHDANDARETFRLLRKTGFDNVSFDLIAGLPDQSLDDWKANLDEAVSMSPEHISLYLLEIHEGTPLAEQIRSGRRDLPDDDLASEMYFAMLERLDSAGYEQYEISNFCRPGRESRHNLKYWELDPVTGFGVSAHSFDGVSRRWANVRDTKAYVSAVELGDSPVVDDTILGRKQLMGEFAFLKLRLNKGMSLDEYEERFGVPVIEEHADDLARVIEYGLAEITDSNRLKLTPKGMVYSNEVFEIFV